MPTHLPLLLNPLLNTIFNNPQPAKSPLKDFYTRLAKSWDDGTIILVPSLDVLLNYTDRDSSISFRDLCYSEEFLCEHVIRTSEVKNARTFTTFTNKEVIIKKDLLVLGKGFRGPQKIKILSCDYFYNFNDYFDKGRRFMIMYIESPIVGVPIRSCLLQIESSTNLTVHQPSSVDDSAVDSQKTSSTIIKEKEQQQQQHSTNGIPSNLVLKPTHVKFEQLMRTFPLIAKSIGEKYENLFRRFYVRDVLTTDELVQNFIETSDSSSAIFQSLSPVIINSILQYSPSIDLNECIYNYVELNLYDKIWNKLCDLKGDFLSEHYKELEHLSLNQVSLPKTFKDNLSSLSAVEKKVSQAINEFKTLSLSTSSESKIKILVDTITVLSSVENITIDADTLVGLLLIVIVHSNVPNIENHLFYAQKFSFRNIDLGMTGYSLSTFEAVLYYLKNGENLVNLRKFSNQNLKVFSCLETKQLDQLKTIADAFNYESDSSLKSRTISGESLLMKAVQANDYNTWRLLIDYEDIFPLEDILNDKMINDVNLLNFALNSENFDIIDEITDILLSSCTVIEIINYLNLKDSHGRTIGHYLFHYKEMISKLGPFIDWTIQDLNGQTPLFAICRSYDSTNYSKLIENVFDTVDKWYSINNSCFDYHDHIDNRGNTLLHILNSKIEILLRYDRIDINETNSRAFTPLMIYAKYNRIENIEKILNDERLILTKTDRNHFTCLDQAKNEQVSSLLELKYLKEKTPMINEKQIGVMRVKLENNNWKLVIRGIVNGKEYTTFHQFNDFNNLIELLKVEFPNSFLPLDHILKSFDTVLNFANYNKLKLNKIIDQLNVFLSSLLYVKPLAQHELVWEFLIQPVFNKEVLSHRSQLKLLNFKQDLLSDGTQRLEKEEVFLQPEEIGEINFFLKFSLKELTKLKFTYDKLLKVVIFLELKAKEFTEALNIFSSEKSQSIRELSFLGNVWNSITKEFKFNDEICDMIIYLCFASDEIIKKANGLLNGKIFKWWKLYGELIELNNSYKKFKAIEMRKTNKHSTEVEVEGFIDVNEEGFHNLTRVASFSDAHTISKNIKTQQPSFLASFIESKRQKYEAKLLNGLSEVKDQLLDLNKEVKFNHETLAMEMNNFLIFKSEFFVLALRNYALKQIKYLKFQNVMLQRGLDDLRSVK